MAVTTLTWTSATSGAYQTSAGWTPAQAPITATYATLINATGAAYTVSVGSAAGTASYSSASVTVNSSDATLQWVGNHALNTFGVSLSAGTLSIGTGKLAILTSGTVTNSGTLSVTGGSFLESGGSVTVASLASFTGGSNTISGGLFNAGTLQVGNGSTTGTFLTLNGGTLDANLTSGAINVLSGATLAIASGGGDIKGVLGGTGAIAIAAGATGQIDSTTVGSGLNIKLGGAGSILDLSSTSVLSGFSATVNGLLDGGLIGTPRNAIQVNGVTGVTASYASGVITLSGGATGTIHLGSSLYDPTTHAETIVNGGNTEIFLYNSAVCFAEGTRILTSRGEIAVEALAEGDTVVTAGQGSHPVRWIGHRHIDLSTHPRRAFAAPVRISRGAFAQNQPQRDLLLSPDHCLFIDGKLIPAKLLVNGMTIVQDLEVAAVTYYHVELDRHAVLLAEGLPAESYLDTGNRAFFSNAGLALILHPEFHVNAGLNCWEQDACAPLAVSDSAVRPVWQDLADRAETLGFAMPEITTTDDADLRLVAAGRTFRPVSAQDGRLVFLLPAGVTGAHLVSRAGSPADVKPWLDDRRTLGVAVSRVVIRSGDDYADIAVDHPALRQGWHAVESEGRAMWRWTDGNAILPIEASTRPVTIEVHVRQSGTYLVATGETTRRLAA